MKTSDIPDEPILTFLAAHQGEWSMAWDVAKATMQGVHDKLQMSKFRSLHRRGLIGGCTCGCRGDFEITDKGLAQIGISRTKKYTGY